mgnify:CR=1 FL=1
MGSEEKYAKLDQVIADLKGQGGAVMRCLQSAQEIFGSPDDLKLHSCATLFASVSPAGSVFERVLGKYFQGRRDALTVGLLGAAGR